MMNCNSTDFVNVPFGRLICTLTAGGALFAVAGPLGRAIAQKSQDFVDHADLWLEPSPANQQCFFRIMAELGFAPAGDDPEQRTDARMTLRSPTAPTEDVQLDLGASLDWQAATERMTRHVYAGAVVLVVPLVASDSGTHRAVRPQDLLAA
ncbi:MAG: hypothetical protein EXR77_16195 [Myxococcales bacterium]|nr:hypothetical protein [Myxococcales bacterium]